MRSVSEPSTGNSPEGALGVAATGPQVGQLYIAGVGASAGGLEALERFFKSMPADTGIAFVVIQHLSPDFKSLMDELLARHTKMAIHRVENGMAVEANSIYLIPPKKEMIIAGGKLLLTDKDPQQDLSLPIDHFFRSLAQDAGGRAIAIVLSGTGSDGSRGIRDIHEGGGLVLVQSEETARFDGMPRSAMDTGVADAALAPEEMPKVLQEHLRRRALGKAIYESGPSEAEAAHGVEAIFKLLRDEYGIDFSCYKPNTVARRIERRLSLNQSIDLEDYVDRIKSDPAELNSLYRDLLIGVTRFFRDRESFERLEKDVFPDLLSRKRPGDEIRLWIAGCATGEEAYSIAILLHERLQFSGRPMNIKIFATDVHGASLETASLGVYDEEALADVKPSRLNAYFSRKQDGYHIVPEIRQMIVFARHNAIKDAPFTKIDLISCRNLLIYFQPAAQKKALSLFHFGLRTGGILFLGPSESPGELAGEFETIDEHWKLYRKRRDVRLPPDLRLPLSSGAPHIRVTAPAPSAVSLDAGLLTAYDRLLEEHMPPGLLITDRRQLVHAFGGAGKYLGHHDGRPTSDVLDLVDDELKLVLAGALQRAAKDQAPIVYNGVRLGSGAEEQRLKLTIKPLLNRHMNLTHFMIFLEDLAAAPRVKSTPAEIDAQEASKEQLNSLESELRYTRENLQATIEELETSNEELQASNEELVASNEELQSTNEELHSVNEELYTVNAEYQKKITELTELTDDMDNLLRSTDIGTIFLDKDLCIRKFTPQIGRAFDLLPQDIGRRIDSFSHNIAYSGLLDDVMAVLKTGKAVEKEVRHRQGSWFFLRILPYRSHMKVEGAVLTLIDISLLKRAQVRLQQLSAIVECSDDAIIGMDLEGCISTWNRGAERLFGYSADEAVGRQVSMLRPPQDRAGSPVEWPPEVAQRMRAGEAANFQLDCVRRRKDGTFVDVLISFSAIRDSQNALVGVSAIARDISERKQSMQLLAQAARMSSLRADVGSILAHEEPLGPILDRCAHSLVEGLGGACVGLWTPGEDGQLQIRAKAGDLCRIEGVSERLGRGLSQVEVAARQRRAIVIADLHGSAEQELKWAIEPGVKAFAAYPLVVAGSTVGALAVFSRREFSQSVLDDIASICFELAQCIQRKDAEEARQTAEEEIREAVRRRDQFLAMLSHELRNPLAAVLNAATLLGSGKADALSIDMARQAIARQAQHMARLLDDLLDVSRITRDKIEIRRQVLDVRRCAQDALDATRPLLESRRLELRVELPPGPVCVDGDPARLQQIQVNLLANAIKYTPSGGQIWMSIAQEGEQAVIRVRDTGMGIPHDMRDKIFELFVQLHRDPDSASGGMGVGLTLVEALVRLHGGEIEVRSDGPGKGSEFVVRIPAVSKDRLESHSEEPVAPLSGLRVVLVEDIADIRTLMTRLLEGIGCEVVSAENGAAGIQAIIRSNPQVALIDIGLPELDGYEVARQIRRLGDLDSVKLVAVTGFGQEEDRRKAQQAGFDAHLVKPVDLNELHRLLCQLSNRPC